MARQGAGAVCAETRRGSSGRSPLTYSSNLRFLEPASCQIGKKGACYKIETYHDIAGRPPKLGRR